MKTIRDCFGRSVRLTNERMAHILQHQEMSNMKAEVERTLQSPAEVRVSRSDNTVQLFYEYYVRTHVGAGREVMSLIFPFVIPCIICQNILLLVYRDNGKIS